MQPTREWLNRPGGLAERLQLMRKAAGLTGDRLAEMAGWPRSKVPKIENGRQMPTEADIRTWAEATGQPEAVPELAELLSQARAVHHQWRHRLRAGHAALQEDYDAFVRAGTRVRGFEVVYIPGLLQTPGYARARMEEAVRVHGADPAGVDAAVQARMRRQQVLYDPGRTFEFVITEACLRFLLCPPEVMAGQLDRLLTASGTGSITLGIIPFGVQLAITPIAGFLAVDDQVITEVASGYDLATGQEADGYQRIFDLLLAEAVTGDAARGLITAAAASLQAGQAHAR